MSAVGSGFFGSRQDDSPHRGSFRPQLTSLVDVMTILLVFLLKSFSVEGTVVTPSSDLELPVTTSQTPPRPILTLEITPAAVIADGEVITALAPFSDEDSLLIDPLYVWLSRQRNRRQLSPEVMIQSDRRLEFATVKRVMFTCSRAGFSDFTILAIGQEL